MTTCYFYKYCSYNFELVMQLKKLIEIEYTE